MERFRYKNEDIPAIVSDNMGISPEKIELLKGGFSNRIYKVTTINGDILLKNYFQDDRDRLNREFGSFSFFYARGKRYTPAPLLRINDALAAYSFEESVSKPANEITNKDLMEIVDFIHDLHSLSPEEVGETFKEAVMHSTSAQEFLDLAIFRFSRFFEHIGNRSAPKLIADFSRSYDLPKLIRLTQQSIKGSLEKPVNSARQRLSPVDFGLHNMLFRKKGGICFIDFEYFGWDDPLKIITNFYFHPGNSGLTAAQKNAFLEKFTSGSQLPPDKLSQLNVYLLLSSIDWISIILWGITPEKLAIKKFSKDDFDTERYIEQQLIQAVTRIEDVKNLLPAR